MFFISKKRVQWWENKKSFVLNGKEYPYFVHRINCGWPPFRMTERSVEMALADEWISARENNPAVIEIGAVTPYYWPCRLKNIVDPADSSSFVTAKKSIFDVSLAGKKVISISTFEHIGNGEYGLVKDDILVVKALDKVFREAEEFFITIPVGYNTFLDKYIFNNIFNRARISFMIRGKGNLDNNWKQVFSHEEANIPYHKSANSLIILVKKS